MREALLYEKLADGFVRCSLCRHRCRIASDMRGICRVRENRAGTLFSLVYGRVVAEQIDPVEKKPLFHVLPGTMTYSIATVGCNFRCLHCQNHSIAQYKPGNDMAVPGRNILPEEVVQRALEVGCRSISYTYTEPTIFFEYMLDVARLASAAGLKNFMVTNGYITPEALDVLAPCIDAANIDLKGFSEDFYRRITGAHLDQVLECIRDFHRRGIRIEITSLIIPGENDSQEQLSGIADFIAKELGTHVPWHISRFFPQHTMTDRVATPPDSLNRAVEAGTRAGLRFMYIGNFAGGLENTDCPVCGHRLVTRSGYRVVVNNLDNGHCSRCGLAVEGYWCCS